MGSPYPPPHSCPTRTGPPSFFQSTNRTLSSPPPSSSRGSSLVISPLENVFSVLFWGGWAPPPRPSSPPSHTQRDEKSGLYITVLIPRFCEWLIFFLFNSDHTQKKRLF